MIGLRFPFDQRYDGHAGLGEKNEMVMLHDDEQLVGKAGENNQSNVVFHC